MTGTYICDDPHAKCPAAPAPSAAKNRDWHCWHESAGRRLAQQGGPSANAAADLAAWNALGQRRKARAA